MWRDSFVPRPSELSPYMGSPKRFRRCARTEHMICQARARWEQNGGRYPQSDLQEERHYLMSIAEDEYILEEAENAGLIFLTTVAAARVPRASRSASKGR